MQRTETGNATKEATQMAASHTAHLFLFINFRAGFL